MNDANVDFMTNSYPRLFRNAQFSPENLSMHFDFGDGWFELINQLSSAIEQEAEKSGLDRDSPNWPEIVDIKEKFGGLRISLNHCTDTMRKLIDDAQARSFHTCEICGAPGVCRRERQLATRCETHAGTLKVADKNKPRVHEVMRDQDI